MTIAAIIMNDNPYSSQHERRETGTYPGIMEALSRELLQADPILDQMVRRLAEAFQPERIYLFGSRARGNGGPDSDYDVLVIVPDDVPPARRSSRLGV